jgi:MFS family permease
VATPLALLRRATAGLPPAFWWLFAGSVVNRTTGFVVPFVAIWLTRERSFTPGQAGLVAALYGAGAVASTLCGGVLADRVGRRATMLAGLCGSAAAVLALASAAGSTPVLALLVLLAGFFGELYRPAVLACIADLVPPEDRERAYGLQYWGVNVGFGVGGVVSGILAERSLAILFVADAATTFAFAALIAARVPETRPRAGPAARATPGGLALTFRDRRLTSFLALQLALFLVFLQLQVTLPLDMAAKGLGPGAFGTVLTVNGAVIALVQPLAAAGLARFEHARVIAAASVVVGLGFFLHALASTRLGYAAAVLVWTIGEIAWLPKASALVAGLAPPSLRGRYQGAYTMVVALAALFAPAFGPALLARAGGAAFWSGCLAVSILVAFGQLALRGSTSRPRKDPSWA